MKKSNTPPPRILRGLRIVTLFIVCFMFVGCSNTNEPTTNDIYLGQAYSSYSNTSYKTYCSLFFNYEYIGKELLRTSNIEANAYFNENENTNKDTKISRYIYIDGEDWDSSKYSKLFITPNTSISICLSFEGYLTSEEDLSWFFSPFDTITIDLYKSENDLLASNTFSVDYILSELEKGD